MAGSADKVRRLDSFDYRHGTEGRSVRKTMALTGRDLCVDVSRCPHGSIAGLCGSLSQAELCRLGRSLNRCETDRTKQKHSTN